jgi:GTPase Era involved in 16S rRNA processing/uncharacterized protein (DUF3820 family)
VIAIGNTGSGKSTFLNLLIDKKIIPTSKGYELSKDDLNKSDCFPIGTSAGSQTLFPKIKEKGNLLFVDLPGLSDNRGDAVAFFNAVFIKDIITKAKTVRFLFVEGQDSFGKRAAALKEMINVISSILGDYKILKGSSIFVMPKAEADKVNIKSCINFLRDKLTSQEGDNRFFSILAEVFKLGDQNPNLFAMNSASNFFDYEQEKYDEKKSERVLEILKQKVMESLSKLDPVEVKKINPRVLLGDGVESNSLELIEKLMEESIPELSEKKPIENMSIPELKNLENKLNNYSIKTLDNYIYSKFPEAQLIKEYDENMYHEKMKSTWDKYLNNKIEKLKDNIKIQKKELEKQELNSNLQQERKARLTISEKMKETEDYKLLLWGGSGGSEDLKNGNPVKGENPLESDGINVLFGKLRGRIMDLQEERINMKKRDGFENFVIGMSTALIYTAYHDGREDILTEKITRAQEYIKNKLDQYAKILGENYSLNPEYKKALEFKPQNK